MRFFLFIILMVFVVFILAFSVSAQEAAQEEQSLNVDMDEVIGQCEDKYINQEVNSEGERTQLVDKCVEEVLNSLKAQTEVRE